MGLPTNNIAEARSGSRRSVRKNFVYNASYQILLIIVPLITTPYLTRVLGPTQSGIFSYTQSVTQYFELFAMLGMANYGVRTIALCGDDRERRSRTFWEVYASQLLVGVIVMAAYIGYLAVANCMGALEGGLLIGALWSMWVLYAVLDVSWLLFGCEEFKTPTIRSMITKVASAVIIFVFIRDEGDLWAYVLAIAGSYLANSLLLWPFVPRYVDFVKPRWEGVRSHLKPNFVLFIPAIAISLYTTMDKIILGALSSMDQVAYFEYSERISRMPLNVVTALGTVMLPHMALALRQDKEKGVDLLDSSIWIMLAAAFAFAFGICACANEFVPVFFGDGYETCKVLMPALVVIIPVISATNVIGRQYLLPLSRDREYTISLIVGAAVNVAMNLLLVPSIQAMGSALATIGAETSILIVQVAMVRKELPLRRYLVNAIPFVGMGLVMLVLVRVAANAMDSVWGYTAKGLLIEILIGFITYVAVFIGWCVVTKSRQFKRLFSKYLPRLTAYEV